MTSPSRVFAILNLFSEEQPVWHTDDINEALSYSRATGYRYVKDLVEAGFLQKVAGGRYSLGARIIELDYLLRRSDPVLLAAAPVIDGLVREAQLDAVMTTMFGLKVVDIYRASVDPTLELGYGRGRPRPVFKGAAPKMLLSHMPRPQLMRVYEAHRASAHEAGLGADWESFRQTLAGIRKQGYYFSLGELEDGVGGFSMVIQDADNVAVAALSLVGTTAMLRQAGEARMLAWLKSACADITARLLRGVSLPSWVSRSDAETATAAEVTKRGAPNTTDSVSTRARAVKPGVGKGGVGRQKKATTPLANPDEAPAVSQRRGASKTAPMRELRSADGASRTASRSSSRSSARAGTANAPVPRAKRSRS